LRVIKKVILQMLQEEEWDWGNSSNVLVKFFFILNGIYTYISINIKQINIIKNFLLLFIIYKQLLKIIYI
jgi:hypothetical protein